jgi:glycosyltransferase involved in cell wall biosynthesis
VEGLVRGLGLTDNVKMLGYVENKLLPLLYNVADITVTPSYSEGSPLVIPESLACGTPVIATNVGGNPEYLNRVGLVDYIINVEQYDFSSTLALKLLKALVDDGRLEKSAMYDAIPSWYEVSYNYLYLLRKVLVMQF